MIKNRINKGILFIQAIGLKNFVLLLAEKAVRRIGTIKKFKSIEIHFADKKGLEIGGPTGYFRKKGYIPIYDKVKTLDGLNFSSKTNWTGQIDKEKGYVVDGKLLGKQFIMDTVDLSPLKKSAYDFVVSCNNIEHIANPMKAVLEWLSVLKPGGALMVIAPRKEFNFDHKRNVVTFGHLLEDFENEVKEDDLTHMEEILQLHDHRLDPGAGTYQQLRERSLKNFENRCFHQHVFDLNVLRKIFKYFGLSIINKASLLTNYVISGRKTVATELLEAVFKNSKFPGSIPQFEVVKSKSTAIENKPA